MLTLHAFFPATFGEFTTHAFANRFRLLLCETEPAGLVVDESSNPFTKQKYLVFRWPHWSFTAHIETGANVADDAKFVTSVASDVFHGDVPDRRVKLAFGDDPSLDFTNHIIWVVDDLKSIAGVVIYDEAKRSVWT